MHAVIHCIIFSFADSSKAVVWIARALHGVFFLAETEGEVTTRRFFRRPLSCVVPTSSAAVAREAAGLGEDLRRFFRRTRRASRVTRSASAPGTGVAVWSASAEAAGVGVAVWSASAETADVGEALRRLRLASGAAGLFRRLWCLGRRFVLEVIPVSLSPPSLDPYDISVPLALCM